MALLTRYKKTGGFLQLLRLIESCSQEKQTKLLSNIEKEDVRWSLAIKEKMLTVERILEFPDEVLGDISQKAQQLTLATALFHIDEKHYDRFLCSFSERAKRLLLEFKNEQKPGPGEIQTALMNIIELTREMIDEGYIVPKLFNPDLVVPSTIEEDLENLPGLELNPHTGAVEMSTSPVKKAIPQNGDSLSYANNGKARKQNSPEEQIAFLSRELKRFKEENSGLKKKLQILEEQLQKHRSAS